MTLQTTWNRSVSGYVALLFIVSLFIFVPTVASSFHCNGALDGHQGGTEVKCPDGTFGSTHLTNPLSGIKSIEDLLIALLTVVQVIAIPIIVFFIIYAGFLYVTARGNVEQTQKATRALLYAVVGGVIIIGAIVISEIVRNIVVGFQ